MYIILQVSEELQDSLKQGILGRPTERSPVVRVYVYHRCLEMFSILGNLELCHSFSDSKPFRLGAEVAEVERIICS